MTEDIVTVEMEAPLIKDLIDICLYIDRDEKSPDWENAGHIADALDDALEGKRGTSFDWYQNQTDETAVYPSAGLIGADDSADELSAVDVDSGILYTALGLNGEAGEVAEKIKKDLRGDDPDEPLDVGDELGDVLWYLTRLCVELDYDLDAVARRNVSKLTDRAERDAIKGSGDDR